MAFDIKNLTTSLVDSTRQSTTRIHNTSRDYPDNTSGEIRITDQKFNTSSKSIHILFAFPHY